MGIAEGNYPANRDPLEAVDTAFGTILLALEIAGSATAASPGHRSGVAADHFALLTRLFRSRALSGVIARQGQLSERYMGWVRALAPVVSDLEAVLPDRVADAKAAIERDPGVADVLKTEFCRK